MMGRRQEKENHILLAIAVTILAFLNHEDGDDEDDGWE